MSEPASDNQRPTEDNESEDTPRPSRYEPVPPPPPVPPEALKPWYYQGWFIVPTFVWWPCSALLFIRSPWHNGVVSGALSWAWLIIGGGWIFLRSQIHWRNGESLVDPTMIALAAPGLALTVITQTLWLLRDRPRIRRVRDAGGFAAYETPDAPEPPAPANRQPTETSRRRSNRGSARSRRRRS